MAHVDTTSLCRPISRSLPLPPKCPELNPTENIWEFMRDNWLSNRVFKSYDDIVDHCCEHGTSSPISPGESCPSVCTIGRMGADQNDLVLFVLPESMPRGPPHSVVFTNWPSPASVRLFG